MPRFVGNVFNCTRIDGASVGGDNSTPRSSSWATVRHTTRRASGACPTAPNNAGYKCLPQRTMLRRMRACRTDIREGLTAARLLSITVLIASALLPARALFGL
ncbi:MAG: hypothetical protein H6733_06030 [Alphaproteobacteria bacterium]|nr:hypothetical protein [Alphaproteobacteria bacterium]